MLEYYKRVHCVPADPQDQVRINEELLALYHSLQCFAPFDEADLGRFCSHGPGSGMLDAKTVASLWAHTEDAVRRRNWPAWRLACEDESLGREADLAPLCAVRSLPWQEVETLPESVYKWRKYR